MGTWYHTYGKHRVEPKNIPELQHFAVLVFQRQTPGYDRYDADVQNVVTVCNYYAFPDKETWEKMISDIYTERHTSSFSYEREEIVFYHCSGKGKVKVNIDVKVSDEK